MLKQLLQTLDRYEYFLLISSHIAMLILYPFVVETTHGNFWVAVLISLILITGLYAASSYKKFLYSTVALGALTFVFNWISFIADIAHVTLLMHITGLIFFSVITYTLILELHRHYHVDHHMVFGAIAGYLLIGMIGAFIFAIIEQLVPGSFTGFGDIQVTFPDFIYYSYVTQTTLGYGDIIPVGYHAQSWSILFTIAGQMYLAVLIGMIVGKYIKKKHHTSMTK